MSAGGGPGRGTVEQVLEAAASIVTAFGSHDTEAYFDGFAPEATFVFHNDPTTLGDRAAYEAVWAGWESEGFHVDGCTSTEQAVTLLGDDVAVFTHRVRTQLRGEPVQHERETIVLARRGGRWLGVHEHLSPDPGHGAAGGAG